MEAAIRSRARQRYILWLIAFIVVILISAEIFLYIGTFAARRKAENLLSDVRALRIGQSTEADIQAIVIRYGGEAGISVSGMCAEPDSTHSVRIENRSKNAVGWRIAFPPILGNRVWAVDAVFVTERGHLCYVAYELRTYLLGKTFELVVSANSQQAGPNSEEVRYDVSAGSIRNIRSFNTRITTDATPYEARRAFNFDLSCLTRFGGCRAGCEVMPSAWLDYQEKAKEKGEAVPADELADPRCKNR